MSQPAPVAIRSGVVRVGTFALRCCVLDDGRRIIEAESFAEFMRWLESPGTSTADVERLAAALATWIHGEEPTA